MPKRATPKTLKSPNTLRKDGKPMKSQQEAVIRRQKVMRLMLDKITQEQIAEALGVSLRTIARDFEAIQNDMDEQVTKMKESIGTNKHLTQYLFDIAEQRRELKAIFRESKTDRLVAFDKLLAQEKEFERVMQLLGVKLSDVRPEDMIVDTIRIIRE